VWADDLPILMSVFARACVCVCVCVSVHNSELRC
jgi:hypothetical protein